MTLLMAITRAYVEQEIDQQKLERLQRVIREALEDKKQV